MLRGLKNLSLVLAITLVLILATEGILYLGWIATKSTKLGTLYSNSIHWRKDRLANHHYPENPERFLKVAVFGGSSSAGNAAEVNLANIIEYELNKTANKPVYVRNYAKSGASFFRNQGEIAKVVAPYYDVLVIYAGNNEWLNYYYANKGFPLIGVVEKKNVTESNRIRIAEVRAEIEIRRSIARWAHDYSRIYAIFSKVAIIAHGYYLNNFTADRGGLFSQRSPPRPPRITESEKLVSDLHMNIAIRNFEASLEEVAAETNKHGSLLVVVPAIGNELFPVYFSVGTADGPTDELLRQAESALLRVDFESIGSLLEPVLANNPRHAFANYAKGMAELTMGRTETAWDFLVRAVDEDGFPHRSPSAIVKAVQSVKTRHPQVIHVNFPEAARRIIEHNPSLNVLYSDHVHPNLLGHVLISRMVLCAISDNSSFVWLKKIDYCEPLDFSNAHNTDTAYRQALRVTKDEVLQATSTNQQGYFVLSRMSAHPLLFNAFAEKNLPLTYGDPNSGAVALAKNRFWAGVYAAMRREDCALVESHIREAQKAAPDIFAHLKKQPFFVLGFPTPAESVQSICANLTSIIND